MYIRKYIKNENRIVYGVIYSRKGTLRRRGALCQWRQRNAAGHLYAAAEAGGAGSSERGAR